MDGYLEMERVKGCEGQIRPWPEAWSTQIRGRTPPILDKATENGHHDPLGYAVRR